MLAPTTYSSKGRPFIMRYNNWSVQWKGIGGSGLALNGFLSFVPLDHVRLDHSTREALLSKNPCHARISLKRVVEAAAEGKPKRSPEKMKDETVEDCPQPSNHRSGTAATNPA